MRKILFKAKRMDNNNWIEGSCVKYDDDHVFILPLFKNASTLTYTQIFSLNAVAVDPNTLCEYTGLVDINGTKIFEGDILSFKENGTEYDDVVEYGIWNCGCCYDVYGYVARHIGAVCSKIATLDHGDDNGVGAYVVGNVYDKK